MSDDEVVLGVWTSELLVFVGGAFPRPPLINIVVDDDRRTFVTSANSELTLVA